MVGLRRRVKGGVIPRSYEGIEYTMMMLMLCSFDSDEHTVIGGMLRRHICWRWVVAYWYADDTASYSRQ